MSNAYLIEQRTISIQDAAIARQENIIATLREALSACVDAMDAGGTCKILQWTDAIRSAKAALALADAELTTSEG